MDLHAAQMRLYRALHEIAVAVGGVFDTAELARIVATGAIALLGADAADVYLWDADLQALRPLYSSDVQAWNAEGLIRPGEGASGQAFQRGIPIHVPDYVGWAHASAFAMTRNVRAALAVPLRVADQTTGALALRFYAPHSCSPEQIEMLCLLAAQVAPALEAARLYTHAQRQIDERMQAEAALRASEERLRRQYQGVPVPTFSWRQVDNDFVLDDFNSAAEALTAGLVRQWVGQLASKLFVDSPEMVEEMRACATEHRTIRRQQPYRPNLTGKAVELDLSFVFVPPDIVMVHTEDVTERRRAEADLRHQTLHDDLTGLPNRVLLNDRLKQAIGASQRDETVFALLLLDLDRFKDVNDTLGHQAGDALLRLIGGRLAGAMRDMDTLARLGGDEFAILLPGTDEAGAVSVGVRLLQMLEEPFELNGSSLDVGGSLGVTVYPQHGDDAEVLLQRADVAMYIAKRAGGGYAVYEPKHDHYTPERLAFHTELRYGIERDELVLLSELGCDEAQGYHLGRPSPADKLTSLSNSDPTSLLAA